ncbi:hypothetical protein PU560_13370, partial [Georgenia sp. 10Sc9-8]|nr:hypothetical protein [Georgenia halotolerans]
MSRSADPHDDQPHGGSYVSRDASVDEASEDALRHPASDRPGEYVRRDEDENEQVLPTEGGHYVDRDEQDVPTDAERGRYVRRDQ